MAGTLFFSLSLTESAPVSCIIYLFASGPHIIYSRDHHRAKIVKRGSRSRLHHSQERFHRWTQTGFQRGYHSVRSRLLSACELQVKHKNIMLISISNNLSTSTLYNIAISHLNYFKVLTNEEAQLLLRVEAGQVTLLFDTVGLSILPVLHFFSLELIAEVPVQQVSSVAVGICSKTMARFLHRL